MWPNRIWCVWSPVDPAGFLDPTGLYIYGIVNPQKQNSPQNRNAWLGNTLSFGLNSTYWQQTQAGRYEAKENTVGNFGCLLTAVVNIGNTSNRWANGNSDNFSSIPVSDLSNTEKYFISKEQKSIDIPNNQGESVALSGGKDIVMSEDTISSLLKDMTGKPWDAKKTEGSKKSLKALKEAAENKDVSSYIIADVGGHWVHITGYSEDENGKPIVTGIDTSERNRKIMAADIKNIYSVKPKEESD